MCSLARDDENISATAAPPRFSSSLWLLNFLVISYAAILYYISWRGSSREKKKLIRLIYPPTLNTRWGQTVLRLLLALHFYYLTLLRTLEVIKSTWLDRTNS